MIPRFYRNWEGRFFLVWPFLIRLRWLFTGRCGYICGLTWINDLDGTPLQQFVPEADCPVHDMRQGASTR